MTTRGRDRVSSVQFQPATPAAFPRGAEGIITGNAAMASHADTRQGIGSSPSGLPGGGVPHDDEPTAFVKTPRQLIVVVILGFAIPIVLIVLLATFVQMSTRVGAG